jgi:hypothetical protein
MDRLMNAWMENRGACWIKPTGQRGRPWIGQVVDPRRSEYGEIFRHKNTEHYVIVRCIDPCEARGLTAGDDYLVLTRFVESPPESFDGDGPSVPAEMDDQSAGTGVD